MAIPVNIDDLINHRVVESTRIEYKSDFNPDPIIRSICAFANDIDNMGGGYIIVGVEENNGAPLFPIKGIEQARIDGILKKLREYCHYIEPLYEPVVEPILYNDVYVIVIWVSGGYGRPYKAPKEVTSKHSSKHYYIRKFANSVIASPQEEKELFYAASNIPFDDRPNLAADISDLDIGLMRTHLKEIGSNLYPYSLSMDAVQIAKDLQLVDGPSENLKPLNVGILMFSERPERYFRYARIEIVDIPDPTGTNMVEKIFTGPIQRQLKDALAYLKNYVLKEVTIKAPDKAEAVRISNYPYAALEEILANAVYHRSYQVNEPITVRITPDSIEITSFPGFDRSITDAAIERLDIRARIYRNRRIGDFLKELKLIEGRNTGFPNARKALDSNGSPSLQFDMNPERDYLSVTIPVHSYFSQQTEKSEKAVAYERQILSCLSSPLSLTELAHAMGYKSITAKLRNTLTELQQSGKVRTVAIDSSVKYTL
jgi:ATP-dependent DNA helicase RecG